MPPLDFLLLCAAAFVLGGFILPAILVPIRIHANHSIAARDGYRPAIEPPHELRKAIEDLAALGFIIRGHWQLSGHSMAGGHLTLLEHPQTLDIAKVMLTRAGNSRDTTLALQTRFDDGTELAVANNRLTTGTPPLPGMLTVWLPQARDSRELYRMHSRVRDSYGAGKKRRPIGPDPEPFLHEGKARVLAHYVDLGLYYLDEAKGVYRPTWKRAILSTWRQMRFIRPILNWRRQRVSQLLRDLGVERADD